MNSQQIGRAGELLVQFLLLREGIESAELTTDSGIDLVAFAPRRQRAYTIQVKTNLKPKPGGGRGKLALDWYMPTASPAELVMCVDLSQERVWLFTQREFQRLAQQHASGHDHLYMWCDPSVKQRAERKTLVDDFVRFRCPERMRAFFLRNGT